MSRMARSRKSLRDLGSSALKHGSLILVSAFFMVPFLWTVSLSLKGAGQLLEYPPQWIPTPVRWENYLRVFEVLPFARFYGNTIIISLLVVGLFTSATPASAALLDKLESIKEKTVQVRGIAFKEPLNAKTVTQADIITLILEELNRQYAPEEFQAYQQSLEKLGLLPPNTD